MRVRFPYDWQMKQMDGWSLNNLFSLYVLHGIQFVSSVQKLTLWGL